jgi:hypothetical protein
MWLSAEQQLRSIYGAVAIDIDIEVDEIDEPRFAELTLGADCRGEELSEVAAHVGADGSHAQLFLVDDIICGAPGLLGISSALPGVPHRVDASSGGIAVALPIGNEGQLGAVIAHELGHLLGLFHNRENDAFSPAITDALEDTPTGEVANTNLMYFRVDDNSGVVLTPQQADVMRAHPWMVEP